MPEGVVAFEIKEHLGVINTNKSGWNKELNVIAWNGNDGKYDIRSWDEHHEKMTRGITLSLWEMQKVTELYLKSNSDKAVARGRAIEEERRIRREQSMNNAETQETFAEEEPEENTNSDQ